MEMEGLVVEFDGKVNRVWYQGITEYPIGGMLAEYSRVRAPQIKDIILAFPKLEDDDDDNEGVLSEFFPWFIDKLYEKYGAATAAIITTEFLDIVVGYKKMDEQQLAEAYDALEQLVTIKDFVFEGTGIDSPGIDSVKQTLLTAYLSYANSYVAFMHTFNLLTSEEDLDENQIQAFMSFFNDHIDFQHIGFQIGCYDGRFISLYTIKTSMSLILFEAAHYFESDNQFVKCANCGNYFIPDGRNDAIYCQFKSPQNSEKTCREIGAQITRANKEKTDISTKEYRKQYMRLKMLVTRHPEKRYARKELERLTTDAKEWRKKLNSGVCTTDDFLNWVKSFDSVI